MNEEIALEDLMSFEKMHSSSFEMFFDLIFEFFRIWLKFIHVSLNIFKVLEKVIEFRF